MPASLRQFETPPGLAQGSMLALLGSKIEAWQPLLVTESSTTGRPTK
jgi:hypothetical protein